MRQALGRGLEALIPKSAEKPGPPKIEGGKPVKVAIDKIRPNHLQPRKHFDPEQLSELASSIKEHGLAQPILVSFDSQTNSYELIAGERRLRASQLAGLQEIEVIVRDPGSEKERLALALIENLQREDLNPIESALGYLRLMKESGITQGQLTQIIGKSKSAISNTLRLLDLPEEIQKALQYGKLSEGHARALLMVENPSEKQKLFSLILEQKLSVRDAEDLARRINEGHLLAEAREPKPAVPPRAKPADIKNLEDDLRQTLGTKVEIRTRKDPSRGAITIHFYSLDDFDKIINIIKK
jgi:ParB family transcriptional regulator, chromosome partitioning protein